MTSLKELGKNLQKIRKEKNLTQAEVAKKASIHVNYYARIERGEENPTAEVLENIAKALAVKSVEFLPF